MEYELLKSESNRLYKSSEDLSLKGKYKEALKNEKLADMLLKSYKAIEVNKAITKAISLNLQGVELSFYIKCLNGFFKDQFDAHAFKKKYRGLDIDFYDRMTYVYLPKLCKKGFLTRIKRGVYKVNFNLLQHE